MFEFLFTDFVFSAEEDGLDVCGGTSGEFFREMFYCGSSHVVVYFSSVYLAVRMICVYECEGVSGLFGLFFNFDSVVGVSDVCFVHCFGAEVVIALWCAAVSTHVGVVTVDDLDGRVFFLS
ncbi:hypothetical protein DJ83_12705 [Halorubrum ezzemoulense]|uniref:Uncharacterized protein n=1 Tax=Halorubrum ezzemoulense TaxID=337243 RepID=A0A256ITL8_HALEZ|nr:hypothetical protein DJ83_12705 [Halorubrum ezzemoulense]